MFIKTNEYQTPIDDELFKKIPEEVEEQFFDCIDNIPFIKNLISPERKRAKDLKRDNKGRIIIDLANPHILEDMDYFRPSALFYEKYGCYTFLKPNNNPNSEFRKWLDEEIRRCWEGYVRPSDGEWVTGLLYFYLNYGRIMLTKIVDNKAHRVEDFPKFWEGIYWRFHYKHQAAYGGLYNDFNGGNNCAELASRGKSKSYSLASILSHNFVLGVNSIARHNTNSVVMAYQKEYLTKDGVINKFITMIDFLADNTQFPKIRLKNSMQELTWIMGYKDLELDINKGTLNQVLGVPVKDDPSKARGKRAADILIEEFGSFPNLLELYNLILPSVEDGDLKFGQIYLLGTSGDSDSDFLGAQEIMYYPDGYNMYSLPNVYDKINSGKPKFVFFFPGYVNREGCYNHDGVSDVTKALLQILMNRYKIKYNSDDPNTIIRVTAEIPITPSEAIIKVSGNNFPIKDLTERLGQIDNDQRFYDDVYYGDLVFNGNGEVEFSPSNETPIRDFPHKNNKLIGSIEIYQMPHIDKSTNKPYSYRYIAGADPYDDDHSETMSLGSIFILDMWTDEIVAEYTGRPIMADEYYEICRKLCIFYNAHLNYENNKKGLFSHFSSRNSLHYLTDNLDFLKDRQMVKDGNYGNKAKGTQASVPINTFGLSLLRKWLLQPDEVPVNEVNDETIQIPHLYKLKSRALIKELISFNTVGNFDRISAMGMLMLLREDRMILFQNQVKVDTEKVNKDYAGNDDFFTRNYDKRKLGH